MANIVMATSLLSPEAASDAPLREALIARGHDITSSPWNGEEQSTFASADLVLLRSCWDYYKDPEAFVAWLNQLERNKVAVHNPVPLVRWNFDKSYLLELRAAGFNVPDTRLVDPTDHRAIPALMIESQWERAVRKPVSGQSGKYVDTLEISEMASWPISEMPTELALLQPFQDDVTLLGETLLFYFHGSFSYAVQRLPKPQNGKNRVQVSVSNEVIAQTQAVLNYLDVVPLYARIDGFIRDDVFVLMELELIEPSFAFETAPEKAAEFVAAIEQELTAM